MTSRTGGPKTSFQRDTKRFFKEPFGVGACPFVVVWSVEMSAAWLFKEFPCAVESVCSVDMDVACEERDDAWFVSVEACVAMDDA